MVGGIQGSLSDCFGTVFKNFENVGSDFSYDKAIQHTPNQIYDKLNEHVIGQARVKMALAVGVHNHYKRLYALESPPVSIATDGSIKFASDLSKEEENGPSTQSAADDDSSDVSILIFNLVI